MRKSNCACAGELQNPKIIHTYNSCHLKDCDIKKCNCIQIEKNYKINSLRNEFYEMCMVGTYRPACVDYADFWIDKLTKK